MPQIEVLPNSTTGATPGWAYVPDTRFDPSKAAIKPSGGRKRGARELGASGRADITSRQNTAIVRHLAELDRENHRDVHVQIPAKKQESRGMFIFLIYTYRR
jgi:zinc finger HIT domain-containing protein 1